jgi:hypothetical protein
MPTQACRLLYAPKRVFPDPAAHIDALAGLILMALGFAGLGYAAQRALTTAKRVAPTEEAASVEAAKVEGVVAKVVDTPLVTEPLATEPSGSSSHEPLTTDKNSDGSGHASLHRHGDSEVGHRAATPLLQRVRRQSPGSQSVTCNRGAFMMAVMAAGNCL